jgi:hypothetical protein
LEGVQENFLRQVQRLFPIAPEKPQRQIEHALIVALHDLFKGRFVDSRRTDRPSFR